MRLTLSTCDVMSCNPLIEELPMLVGVRGTRPATMTSHVMAPLPTLRYLPGHDVHGPLLCHPSRR